MSTLKSNNENMTINADGASSEVKFQANGVEKASISAAGAFTSTTIDATALTGNLPAISGASLTGVGGLQSQQVFTSSGTWTKPSGVNLIKVYVTGGGGGGAGGSATNNMGGGGGAGGTSIEIIDVSAVSTVTVTVGTYGSGGSGNIDGGDGNTSSFGAYCSATGGTGGDAQYTGSTGGGKGGVGSSGGINIDGGDGLQRSNNSGTDYSAGGLGGASYWGGGGQNALKDGTNQAETGKAYGSGGGAAHSNTTVSAGKNGKSGIVVVEEYK